MDHVVAELRCICEHSLPPVCRREKEREKDIKERGVYTGEALRRGEKKKESRRKGKKRLPCQVEDRPGGAERLWRATERHDAITPHKILV